MAMAGYLELDRCFMDIAFFKYHICMPIGKGAVSAGITYLQRLVKSLSYRFRMAK